MALGGPDRTFKTLKVADGNSTTASAAINHRQPGAPGIAARFYSYLNANWLRSPDAFWTWERPAVATAVDLIRRHNIRVVFTSADPYTSHRIGYQLQQMTGVRWIADFRDPHTHGFFSHSQNNRVFGHQRNAERLAVMHADRVTVAADSIALILMETYGLRDDSRIHFIPTGLDEALLRQMPQGINKPPVPYFVFSGEFLPTHSDEFFRLFAKAVQRAPEIQPSKVRILFIGRREINQMRILPFLKQHRLEEYVDFLDHMPQQKLYAYLQGARAALMINGRRQFWWCLFAKLVDYIALRKPVIAIVPNPSEARMHLENSGLGIFLDGDHERAVERLRHLILNDTVTLNVDEMYCERFLALSQVQSFTKLMEGLL
jgi:glycosyltransferase involved in cell wall biosynthesis